MAKKLKFSFNINGKKAGTLNLPVNEMIHMDIERKLGDAIKKAYCKVMTDNPNPVHALVEIDRELWGCNDALQQLADMALAQKPIKADLKLVLSNIENMGEEIKCKITL